MISLFSQGEPF